MMMIIGDVSKEFIRSKKNDYGCVRTVRLGNVRYS